MVGDVVEEAPCGADAVRHVVEHGRRRGLDRSRPVPRRAQRLEGVEAGCGRGRVDELIELVVGEADRAARGARPATSTSGSARSGRGRRRPGTAPGRRAVAASAPGRRVRRRRASRRARRGRGDRSARAREPTRFRRTRRATRSANTRRPGRVGELEQRRHVEHGQAAAGPDPLVDPVGAGEVVGGAMHEEAKNSVDDMLRVAGSPASSSVSASPGRASTWPRCDGRRSMSARRVSASVPIARASAAMSLSVSSKRCRATGHLPCRCVMCRCRSSSPSAGTAERHGTTVSHARDANPTFHVTSWCGLTRDRSPVRTRRGRRLAFGAWRSQPVTPLPMASPGSRSAPARPSGWSRGR